MIINRVIVGVLKTNCYIISTDKNNGIIFDPGADFDKINDHIIKHNITPSYIFLTHGHYDHIGAINELKSQYPKIKIAISKNDLECLTNSDKNLSQYFNANYKPISSDIIIKDNFKFNLDDVSILAILTPGHTKGGVCYLINQEILLTGDTLFKNNIGRTDLYGGNEKVLKDSIKKIYNILKPNKDNPIKIFPGHWFSSSLEKELYSNPYLNFLNNFNLNSNN